MIHESEANKNKINKNKTNNNKTNKNNINKKIIIKHTNQQALSNSCLIHTFDFWFSAATLGMEYWLLVEFPTTLCRVEPHFGSWLLVPILGFYLYLTIQPSFISVCFWKLFLSAFWRCQLTQRWFSFLRASLGLIWIMLCSVELHFQKYLFIFMRYPLSFIFI